MQFETRPALFYGFWLLTFLGMPIGGGLARVTVGPADEPLRSLPAGAIADAVIGLTQWLVLRQVRPVSPMAWTITRAVGVDLSQNWVVFGVSGAIVFAVLTAVVLWWMRFIDTTQLAS